MDKKLIIYQKLKEKLVLLGMEEVQLRINKKCEQIYHIQFWEKLIRLEEVLMLQKWNLSINLKEYLEHQIVE
jgi:hypothetical protein